MLILCHSHQSVSVGHTSEWAIWNTPLQTQTEWITSDTQSVNESDD